MSESAVKAARRDLRRTLGVDGLSVVQQSQAHISSIGQSVSNAHARLDHLGAKMDDRWLATAAAQKKAFAEIYDFQSKTFWERLRWLVFGR